MQQLTTIKEHPYHYVKCLTRKVDNLTTITMQLNGKLMDNITTYTTVYYTKNNNNVISSTTLKKESSMQFIINNAQMTHLINQRMY